VDPSAETEAKGTSTSTVADLAERKAALTELLRKSVDDAAKCYSRLQDPEGQKEQEDLLIDFLEEPKSWTVPARIVWTRFCNSGGLFEGGCLTGFQG
jgi:hypothetical protein